MPTRTFFDLAPDRRERLVREAIVEFSEKPFAEASLSQIAQRSRIPKGSFYQYFTDKLDLYRWLVTEETPHHKRCFLSQRDTGESYWQRFENRVEQGMAFLVEHPRLARLSAVAADPSALPEVRGLHRTVCEAGLAEWRTLLAEGVATRELAGDLDLDVATSLVAAVIGPGLTDVILRELGAPLHVILASDDLRSKLGPRRRRRLATQAVALIRGGLGAKAHAKAKSKMTKGMKR
jgi:AcrR family transcriptional regulator